MADDGVKAVAAPEPAALDDENDDARSVDSDELDSLEQTSNMDQDKYDDFVATCQVLPECVYTGMESKEHYAASMRKAHTLSVDTLETAREHRWKLAEQKLSRRSMCSPTSVLRKRWDAAQVSSRCPARQDLSTPAAHLRKHLRTHTPSHARAAGAHAKAAARGALRILIPQLFCVAGVSAVLRGHFCAISNWLRAGYVRSCHRKCLVLLFRRHIGETLSTLDPITVKC